MHVTLSRKRSRLTTDADDLIQQRREPPSPALATSGDTLKRSKTQCELDELDVISAEHAWSIDVDAVLASNTRATPTGSTLPAHNNNANFRRGESLVVLCVQGNVQVHYELLCAALPDLYTLSPSLQAFVLCHDPCTHTLSASAPFSLPLIQAATRPNNHFVRLGLLHPLGGGKFPLDALVVLDSNGKRRLVLPFGWGAGKHAATPVGRGIAASLLHLLQTCVETLEQERRNQH
ncbi:hypothetical protein BDW02DRAFT_594777 [Decorospora gaudefroyi]|uniref:Uncharacterized protein n=1 Tax=Decorospora gaudefroyi TaxID=184978 RepID=A0A6A5KQA2_9PLEO|nr:hypothetical protein BDW02DRAFT_594777 [Decorospora gaudefroyi]